MPRREPDPSTIDPQGRFDLLVFRLAEKAAETNCQGLEWPLLRPLVWKACSSLQPRQPGRTRKAKR